MSDLVADSVARRRVLTWQTEQIPNSGDLIKVSERKEFLATFNGVPRIYILRSKKPCHLPGPTEYFKSSFSYSTKITEKRTRHLSKKKSSGKLTEPRRKYVDR